MCAPRQDSHLRHGAAPEVHRTIGTAIRSLRDPSGHFLPQSPWMRRPVTSVGRIRIQ